jgi:hypothetical protein
VDAVLAIYLVAALMLAVGGVLKARRPAGTTGALRELGFAVPPAVIRIGGAAEVAVGVAAVVGVGPVPPALVGLSYGLFAGFVIMALRRGTPLSSCGCFGETDTPPGWGHVVLNVIAAAVSVAWALQPRPDAVHAVSSQPGAGIPLVLMVVVAAGLVYLVLIELPRTMSVLARRRHP